MTSHQAAASSPRRATALTKSERHARPIARGLLSRASARAKRPRGTRAQRSGDRKHQDFARERTSPSQQRDLPIPRRRTIPMPRFRSSSGKGFRRALGRPTSRADGRVIWRDLSGAKTRLVDGQPGGDARRGRPRVGRSVGSNGWTRRRYAANGGTVKSSCGPAGL
jgi:hypothetical protein